MSLANQSLTNVTTNLQYLGVLETMLFFTLTTLPCCVFLFINGTMLFTLRSKALFRETSRYILLYNLLFADTAQMALSELLYIIAACKITLTYPVCGFLTMLANLATVVSPLTLVVMSLERYVAVCYPLRHATIITIRKTGVAITVIWAFSSLNILIRVLLLLEFPFETLDSLQMKDFCSDMALFFGSVYDAYDRAFTCVLFISASVAITSSYIGVIVAARSASADKASAHKARNTLLLHLVQLGLCLSSTIYNPLLTALARVLKRIEFVRIQIVFLYMYFIVPQMTEFSYLWYQRSKHQICSQATSVLSSEIISCSHQQD